MCAYDIHSSFLYAPACRVCSAVDRRHSFTTSENLLTSTVCAAAEKCASCGNVTVLIEGQLVRETFSYLPTQTMRSSYRNRYTHSTRRLHFTRRRRNISYHTALVLVALIAQVRRTALALEAADALRMLCTLVALHLLTSNMRGFETQTSYSSW